MIRKSLIALACLTCSFVNPVFASQPLVNESDFAAILNDPNDGLLLLKAAQYSMLSITSELGKMQNIASQAASGTHSSSELQALDVKFQQYKQKSQRILYKAALGGSLIFNHGKFSIRKNGNQFVIIDLQPKDAQTLGILNDNIASVVEAKTAIEHLSAANDILIKWIPKEIEQNVQSKSTFNPQKASSPFDSSVLYIKTLAGAETTLQSIESTRNEIMNLLTQMRTLATQAASDSTTPAERAALNIDFRQIVSEINRVTAANNFSEIKAFDGSVLYVHDNAQTYRSYDLPVLNIKTLGIANDDVLSNAGAQNALQDLNSASDKISIWLATGKYDSSYQSKTVLIKQK